jgi:cytoskeletal protein CcmA (bactofilin family)
MWKRDASQKPVDLPPVQPALVSTATPATPAAQDSKALDSLMIEQVVASLGRSMTIKGELSASEDLTLHGQMDGRVTLPEHTLTIGPEANIRAEITAGAVVIMGAVVGNVTASKRVEIRATGSVTGDISSSGLAIDDGGLVVGKVQMTGRKEASRRSVASG